MGEDHVVLSVSNFRLTIMGGSSCFSLFPIFRQTICGGSCCFTFLFLFLDWQSGQRIRRHTRSGSCGSGTVTWGRSDSSSPRMTSTCHRSKRYNTDHVGHRYLYNTDHVGQWSLYNTGHVDHWSLYNQHDHVDQWSITLAMLINDLYTALIMLVIGLYTTLIMLISYLYAMF